MTGTIKNQAEILSKLGIEKLNPMQEETSTAIRSGNDVVLLSPTGSGKTLAFLLPIVEALSTRVNEVQVLILVPSRELAIQIEQVAREMGAGFKTNAIYGGRAVAKDREDLKHPPAILIGTPGRIADHMRRESFATEHIKTLVLDEFDKSLEVGFESEMREIKEALEVIKQTILTSATQQIEIPDFIDLQEPHHIDYLLEGASQLQVKTVISPSKDKLETLADLLFKLKGEQGIVFCNFKDSIQRVSEYLVQCNISHGCFYGGMEQRDRERALIQFRNGSHNIILATDLAARGIDISDLKFIVHYHLPLKAAEFTHRNGRTARMNSDGTAYIIQWEKEIQPDFIKEINPDECKLEDIQTDHSVKNRSWTTLFVSGGRKDKISKGDIAGLFLKQGKLSKDELGVIELKQDCAFLAVETSKADELVTLLNNCKLKKRKIRVNKI